MSEAATEQGGTEAPANANAAQQAPATTSWDDLFKDEDPAKVREALENSRKWETRAKENFEKAQQFDQLEEAKKTEQQKLTERAEKAEADGRTATTENARLRAILATLPEEQSKRLLDLAGRLRGETPEELLEDAKQLLAVMGNPTAPPSFDGGSRQPAKGGSDMNALIRQAAGLG